MLGTQVSSSNELSPFLHGIRCSETLDEALKLRHSVKQGESIITKDGIWLGANWLRISRDNDASTGVLARENSIRECQQQLSELEQKAEKVSGELNDSRTRLQSKEQQREEIKTALNTIHSRLNEIKAQITARESRHEHITSRGKDLDAELEETQNLISSDESDIAAATRHRNAALENAETMEVDRKALQEQRDELQQQLQ